MKVLGKLKKRKVESEYVRPVTKIVCDNCGKVINELYGKITTHHDLWGKDSCDSFEYYDLCFECSKQMFDDYLKKPRQTEQFEYECKRTFIGEEIVMDENGGIDIFEEENCILESDYESSKS